MCERVVEDGPETLEFVLDHLKTKEMCGKAVEKYPCNLKIVPDHLKIQEMCNKTVCREPYTMGYDADQFVTQEQIDLWDDEKFFKWYEAEWCEGYQKRKAQKAQIKKELMPIAWRPPRWSDWCFLKDEKKETEKLWA